VPDLAFEEKWTSEAGTLAASSWNSWYHEERPLCRVMLVDVLE
jgi:hypothetical protein